MKNRKDVMTLSIVLAGLFIGMQFVFMTTASGGGWCTPYLGAPQELGHPLYESVSYGFPLPLLTVEGVSCFQAKSTNCVWSPAGLGVDGLLLVLIMFPIWRPMVKRKSAGQE